MSLISLVIAIAVVGFLLWAVNTLIPMDPTVRKVLSAVVVLAVLIWVLQALGVLSGHTIHVG